MNTVKIFSLVFLFLHRAITGAPEEITDISRAEIKEHIKKTVKHTYKKIRFKDDKKVSNYLNEIFSFVMRNHHIEFKKRLVSRITKGKSIDNNRKHELFRLIDSITLCAPLIDADEFDRVAFKQYDTKKLRRAKPKKVETPALVIEENKSLAKLIVNPQKGIIGVSLCDLAANHELDSDANNLLNYAIKSYNYIQVTLQHLREEILLGFYNYDFFQAFNPPAREQDSDEKYITDLLEFHDEMEVMNNQQRNDEYVNLGVKDQLYGAYDRLEECRLILNALLKNLTGQEILTKELSEF